MSAQDGPGDCAHPPILYLQAKQDRLVDLSTCRQCVSRRASADQAIKPKMAVAALEGPHLPIKLGVEHLKSIQSHVARLFPSWVAYLDTAHSQSSVRTITLRIHISREWLYQLVPEWLLQANIWRCTITMVAKSKAGDKEWSLWLT
jgi:hypothetical protein